MPEPGLVEEVVVPLAKFAGEVWGEIGDDHKRDLAGVLAVLAGLAVLGSAADPQQPALHALHRLIWWSAGDGWPLLGIGLLVGGAVLIHPPKASVQRFQAICAAVAAWSLLGLLGLLPWTSGGALGLIGPLVARGVGPWLAGLLLMLVVVLAVVLAARLRMSDAVRHAARAAGLAGAPRKAVAPGRVEAGRGTTQRQVAAAGDQLDEDARPVATAGPAPLPAVDEAENEDEALAGEEDDEVLSRPAGRSAAAPAPAAVAGTWRMPPIALLDEPAGRTQRQEAETRRQVAKIESKLSQQKIGARVTAVNDGPSLTQYVVQLDDGVLVKQVVGLHNDLSLVLAAPGPLRIQAPIPGMSAIGLEVPKERRRLVALRELLEAADAAGGVLTVGLGSDVAGAAVLGDLAKMPHLLVAGATGQGKSVFINALVVSLLLRHTPRTLRLVMIDPKRVELIGYQGLPHLAAPVIVEPDQAQEALGWAVDEMDRRYKALAAEGVRNIAAYNERRAGRGELPMPYVVVVVDELADLMMVSRAERQAEKRAGSVVEELIVRLAQLARAVGIHLVVATQRPSVDVITGLIKANIPSRIAFTVASGSDSRTILDTVGAEKLMGKGDLLYQPVDGPQVRLQGAFLEDREVDAVVEHWRAQGRPEYLGGLYTPESEAAGARTGGDES